MAPSYSVSLSARVMKKMMLSICLLTMVGSKAFSQTIPVGSYAEDIARRDQLLGKSNDLSSFSIRPVNGQVKTRDSSLKKLVASKVAINSSERNRRGSRP